MTLKDTLLVTVSDFHSGSNYALFPDRVWHGTKEMNHTPTANQQMIRRQFETFAADVRKARKGKRVILVHNGDCLDGDHHNSSDVCTANELEQADIHIELMTELQKRIGWRAGDLVYYTRGTETHTHEYENYIGEQMNAVMCGNDYVFDLLELDVNGVIVHYVHHGPRRGQGANEGNAERAWLKNIFYDALKDKVRPPDIVYSGHTHDPTMAVFEHRTHMDFGLMYGVILPSWQSKTRFAWEKAPVSKNKIGGVWQEIRADGTILLPRFSVLATEKTALAGNGYPDESQRAGLLAGKQRPTPSPVRTKNTRQL